MLRPSVKKFGSGWKAVHRNEREKVIWQCGHLHKNRDASTRASGMSALDCAVGITDATLPEVIRRREAELALLKGGKAAE